MEKILKKYTTIPQHLYVNRNADLQLKSIIEEMQRPGYVLVARQMGKTNLLINAKRTLENPNRLFAYVDLSNLYSKERECYRNIINCIIEPNIDSFAKLQNEIDKIREKELPPHNEYSRSLVCILNSFKGDLVVILDEIDALKSVEYSDNIFAQIRSNYFSRTNYPVLERLTYVLSGVIEPTELIKDKNKSPFNIGDKIYLDDFTKEEFNSFIQKSKLQLTQDVHEVIFKWTNGNPRLTFDVCAEIENYLILNGTINIAEATNIITNKYLINYDISPIDHIRELVKSNRDIRKSIVDIYNKNVSAISDEIRRKLYLYGIIGSNVNDDIYIKNKIIEKSISLEWLKSIEKIKEASFVSGLAKYAEKYYSEALDIFEELISSSKNDKDVEASSYFAGMSSMKLKEYEKALKYFSFEFRDKTYKEDSLAFFGVCQIANGDFVDGLTTLENAVKNETNTNGYQTALLNLAINEKDKEKSLTLLEKLYESTFISENVDEDELNQLRSLSLYYQAEIFERKHELEIASTKIQKALENCKLEDSLFLLYYQDILSNEKNIIVKTDLVDKIVVNKLRFEEGASYPISFSEDHIYFYLNWVFDNSNPHLFEKLLSYTTEYLLRSKSKFDIAIKASKLSKNKQKDFLQYLLQFEAEIEEYLLLDIYRDLSLLNTASSTTFSDLFSKYLRIFNNQDIIIVTDIYVFAFAIKNNYEKKYYNEALNLCDTVSNKLTSITDEELIFESLIIFYWYSYIYFNLNNNQKAIENAEITLQIIKNSDGKHMSLIDEAGITSIEKQLIQIRSSSLLKIPIKSHKLYGRNDKVRVKYSDGIIAEKKYKYVEADILAGRCEIEKSPT